MAWNAEGGGFDTSPSVDASQSLARERGGYQEKNGMKPVCIKSIHKAFVDDQFTAADGSGLQQVTLIAKVISADSNAQRFDYQLGDSTGATVQAREYINDEDVEQPELITQGAYVRVYGTLKSFQGAPHIVINRIDRTKDPNEITMHLVEMTHTYLKMKQVGGASDGPGTVDSSADLNVQVRKVIQGNKSMTGLSIAEIKAALPHASPEDITGAINYLSGEGVIFSTIDDEHFRATEDA